MPNTYFDTAKIIDQVSSLIPIIDGFEDNDLSEYSGDTGAVTLQTSTVFDGNYAATIADGENEILSTSGLDNYPSQGDIFTFNTYIRAGSKPRVYWGVQDSDDYYYLEFDDPNSTLRFVKVEAGSETTIDTASITFDVGVWSETKVEWRTNGRHIIEHFEDAGNKLGEIDATDSTFTQGGFGFGEWS